MQIDPRHEWERLTHLYAEKNDEEIQELAADFGNLTEVARQVLRDEMKKRKLGSPETAHNEAKKRRADDEHEQPAFFGRWNQPADEKGPARDSVTPDPDSEQSVEYTWKTELCTCDNSEEAWQIAEVLRRAGIESWPDRPGASFGTPSLASEEIRILVAADQLDDARTILAQPIPRDVIDQSREKVEDFVPPTCPKCGAADPLLESIDPANTWLCENCGARWGDAFPVENAVQNPP